MGRQLPFVFMTLMIFLVLGISVPFRSLGEPLSATLLEGKQSTDPIFSEEITKESETIHPGSVGIRAEELEKGQSLDHQPPQQPSVSSEKPELVETTDASGGTMINLQGQFQCGLKVSPGSTNASGKESLAPMPH